MVAASREQTALVVPQSHRPNIIPPAESSIITLSPLPRWRQYGWKASALLAGGALLIAIGAVTLSRPASAPLAPREPSFADAATKALFLQASYDWNLRTPDSLTRAVREYSDTIGRDPRVPVAYVGLANSYLLLREYGSLPDADAYVRAKAAAQAAVALSPSCAEAHRALAFIAFWWRQDRAAAHREFNRALALKPNDPLTHHWLATALLANGEAKDALREIDRARDLDPVATSIVADRATILYFAGHRVEGLASLRALSREEPQDAGSHRSLAEIALFEGRTDEFLRESTAMAQARNDTAMLADVARWSARGSGATTIEGAMLRDAENRHSGWFRVAKIAALMGRTQEAKDALSHACKMHEPATISALSDLWLSRALSPSDITERCGRVSLLS